MHKVEFSIEAEQYRYDDVMGLKALKAATKQRESLTAVAKQGAIILLNTSNKVRKLA